MNTIPPTTVVTYTPPDATALERRAQGVLGMVRAFTIENDGDYIMAGEELSSVKRRIVNLQADEDEIVKPIVKGLKAARDLFRRPLEMLETAEGLWKDMMLGYREKVAAAATEAQRVAEIAAQAERDRLAAEAVEIKRKADEEIARLPVDQETGEIDQASIERIQQTALFEAQAVEQTAAVIVAAPVAAEVPKIKGQSVAKSYEGVVEDLPAFIRFVAANLNARPELAGLLIVDSVKLRAHVKASGANLNFPGILVKAKNTMRVGS